MGTRFVVVHSASVGPVVERWFTDAGHPTENVELVAMPDYVFMTDWAEDAYVSLKDRRRRHGLPDGALVVPPGR